MIVVRLSPILFELLGFSYCKCSNSEILGFNVFSIELTFFRCIDLKFACSFSREFYWSVYLNMRVSGTVAPSLILFLLTLFFK